jgi:hypothetical protein
VEKLVPDGSMSASSVVTPPSELRAMTVRDISSPSDTRRLPSIAIDGEPLARQAAASNVDKDRSFREFPAIENHAIVLRHGQSMEDLVLVVAKPCTFATG